MFPLKDQLIIPKDKIFILASSDQGFIVDCTDPAQEMLRKRMRIFHSLGMVYVQKRKNKLNFKLAKDTYLL